MTHPPDSLPIRRAMISVSDKKGLVPLARALAELGVELLSTGGTQHALAEAGVPVTPVEQVTGFPEMLDGRVKTLHPAVHGGILADRGKPDHMAQLQAHGIGPIDLVVVNLYPFTEVVALPETAFAEAIENIDIGGPAMVRSAAKNHGGVAVLTDPEQYDAVVEELRRNGGALSGATRARMARAAFARTAAYDAAISAYLEAQVADSEPFPETLSLSFRRGAPLRYGENPHQLAAFYLDPAAREPGVATGRQVHGGELSFVNLLDLDAALELVKEFAEPACAIIKHTNPCGCAIAATLAEAYRLARDGEPPPFNPPGSRFGGILACNREVDAVTAAEMVAPQSFYHALIAPGFSDEAREVLTSRKGWGAAVRLLATDPLPPPDRLANAARGLDRLDLKRVVGGLLVQERDLHHTGPEDLQVVTDRAPTEAETGDLLFAWRVVRHVKSNAIVIARGGQVIGVGAGQMNRALPSRLAVEMAADRAPGSVAASDAFFPFPDGPEALARAGVTAIIQPGGAKLDADSIALCNRHNVAMVFTGRRHFRH